MVDSNQQVEEPVIPKQARIAQKEFNVILDVLRVPLKADISNQKVFPHRGWRGGCLLELKYPDLVPVNPDPNAGPEGYCKTDDENRLIITVKNQGTEDAPRSVTRVIFSPGGSFDLETAEIRAGQSVNLSPLEIPSDCLDSDDCKFKIIVDADNQVMESNEANNIASGTCGELNE